AIHDALAPGPVVLVGHSMGGRIALGFAARRTERLRGLALLDSRLGDVDPALAVRWRGRIAGGRDGRGDPPRAAARAAFRFAPRQPRVAPDTRALLAHHAIRERAPGDWTFRFDRAVLSLDGDRAGDLSPLLARVECPVLLAAGERSWVLDAAERRRLTAAQPAVAIEVF